LATVHNVRPPAVALEFVAAALAPAFRDAAGKGVASATGTVPFLGVRPLAAAFSRDACLAVPSIEIAQQNQGGTSPEAKLFLANIY